ncbi:synaptotagmin-B isoform X2 [Strongylocentrotus purpuratus]|nr:synaptotagmin-B isoform X2 [Strongylocentrotus purpuratus]
MSVDIDRLNAINKLHMLCVRQFFEASTRDLGEIELALQYDRRRRRLRVRVLQANGVGLRSASRKINTHVRLCLMPEKQNPQQTRLVIGTCDPTYNEDFFFNVPPCELISSGLKVRVFQSSGLLLNKWPASCVGEVLLNLEQLKDNSKEIFIREDLKPKAAKEDTGILNVSICYRSRIRKLCITVIRAQNLSKTGFCKTSPDCRIKVAVTQVKDNALSTVVKRTRVRRHTRQPVFKESMSFEINDLNNLRDGMTVVCSLSGKSLTGKPQTLGQVRFGLGASRETEKLQWANVLRNPGLSITQWHTL